MKLIIVHYHLRPGGVRRVIELAAPHLVRGFDGVIECVTLVAGEAADAHWQRCLRESLAPTTVEFLVGPAFRYFSERQSKPATLRRRLRTALAKLLEDASRCDFLVWAHNLGLGRNLLLNQELIRACAARGIPLVAHHHDWWFDNRWQRWAEMRQAGFRNLNAVAETVFSPERNVHHVAINQTDARILCRHFRERAGWLPNLSEPDPRPARLRAEAARRWLGEQLGEDAPVWLMPCRLLRRKNIAEALLLTRWLRPEAFLVTTGGVSSEDERSYATNLAAAARTQRWRLRLGVLQGDESSKPAVPELLAASEAVLLTSIQEGFGLPYLEAAAARRPLIARVLPNVAPDLARFDFHFPQSYTDILIDPRLFDWEAEARRQAEVFQGWLANLPRAARPWAGEPCVLKATRRPRPVPFSRLTLTAQLEVLSHPLDSSWDLCAPLNPFLPLWRKRTQTRRLQVTRWPQTAAGWLNGAAYAKRFWKIVHAKQPMPLTRSAVLATQTDFMHERLAGPNLFPLLWSRET